MSTTAEKVEKYRQNAQSQLEAAGVKNIDSDRLADLANRMKIMIDNKDALLVSTSDEKELETVRKNFVVKKLGIDDKERGMAAIHRVADKMKGVRQKNRAAFYYMVQDELS